MVKHLSATLIAVLLLTTTSLTAPKASRLLDSITTLQHNGRNSCSTTAINQKKAFFLLAAHCFGGGKATDPLTIDGKFVRIMKLDVAKDLAVVMVAGTNRPALKLAKDAPDYLDEVYVAGHPLGWNEPTIFRGWVAAPSNQFEQNPEGGFDRPYMILQVPGAPGNSGSSVVNNKMEIVGVVQIGWNRDGFSPLMGASPYADLVAFAAKYFE